MSTGAAKSTSSPLTLMASAPVVFQSDGTSPSVSENVSSSVLNSLDRSQIQTTSITNMPSTYTTMETSSATFSGISDVYDSSTPEISSDISPQTMPPLVTVDSSSLVQSTLTTTDQSISVSPTVDQNVSASATTEQNMPTSTTFDLTLSTSSVTSVSSESTSVPLLPSVTGSNTLDVSPLVTNSATGSNTLDVSPSVTNSATGSNTIDFSPLVTNSATGSNTLDVSPMVTNSDMLVQSSSTTFVPVPLSSSTTTSQTLAPLIHTSVTQDSSPISLSPTETITTPAMSSSHVIPVSTESPSTTLVSSSRSALSPTSHVSVPTPTTTPSIATSPTPTIPASSAVFTSSIPPVGPTTSSNTVATTAEPVVGTGFELIIPLSVCGASLLIFLIVALVLCCRKRKYEKVKYEPSSTTQDLWVTRSEVPLNHIDSLTNIDASPDVEKGSLKLENGHTTPIKTATEEDLKYIVVYPFQANLEQRHLELEKDDIVTVTKKNDNGWWEGKIGDRTGWFPGSYVKEINKTEDDWKTKRLSNESQPFEVSLETENNDPPPVSSFFSSTEPKLNKKAPIVHRESSRLSTISKHTLGKEVAIPHIPNDEEDKQEKRRSTVSPAREDYPIEGTKFKVLYNYSANFKEEISLQEGEIVTGIVKERNGWMKGKRNRTNEVGYFPAVYVEKATQEDIEAAVLAECGYPDKETVYKQLHVNKTSHYDEDLVGIEHVATCPYAAEDEHDLSFDIGDTVLVYSTLDSGWWLGSRGDEVGWFPGAYVELVEDDPTELKYKGPDELTVTTPVKDRSNSYLSINSASNFSKTSDDNVSVCSSGTTGTTDSGRRRPVRKAPAPPKDNSKSPRTPPARPPNPPSFTSWTNVTESTPKSANHTKDSSNNESTNRGMNGSDCVDGKLNQSLKPEVPKRFIKPKLVKVSKKKINLKPASNSSHTTKSPPPRPDWPKHIPKSPLNRSKDSSHNYGNNQHNSSVLDSDISGVEAMPSFSSDKDQSLVQNNSHNDSIQNSIDSSSKYVNGEHSPKIPSFKNIHKELSPNEARHSTPKIHEPPNFNNHQESENYLNGHHADEVKSPVNDSVRSETSVTDLSGVEDTDSDYKSITKVPQSPKRSRLPKLAGDKVSQTSKTPSEGHSSNARPPVAPKPNRHLQRPKFYGTKSSSFQDHSQSEIENSSHDQSSVQDDSSILIHDGLDSSNNTSHVVEENNVNGHPSSQIKRPSIPVPHSSQKSPQKQNPGGSRIPKTSIPGVKRDSSLNRDIQRQTSITSEDSNVFHDNVTSSTSKPKRPDESPSKTNGRNPSRKTSASPSRIPLGKSPTRKPKDSASKATSPSKIPHNKSIDKNSADSGAKVPSQGDLPQNSSDAARKSSPSKTFRGRSSIPISRPLQQSKNFVSPGKVTAEGDNPSLRYKPSVGNVMKKAVSGYEALNEEELSFTEGSLITEISQDISNPGWFIGMLADGSMGRFHKSFVIDVPDEDIVAV